MAMHAILWVVCPLLVLAGLVGVYEYTLYTPEQRARAPNAARALLATWIAGIAGGLVGIALLATGNDLSWVGFYLVMLLAFLGPLSQHVLHRAADVDRSPLLDRHL